ncbi:TPA: restriction endonuclease subunit S [Streptococcus suis]|nr:restriction endonuclease subunit S [Streptococcus suis]
MGLRYKKLSDFSIGKGCYGIAASAVNKNESLPTYLRITDINDDGTLNLLSLKSVDDAKADKYFLQPNDIVFARTGGSTGRNYFYDGKDGEFVFAGFLIKFSIDPEKCVPKFIKYYCQSKEYQNWVSSFNTGSTRGNINAKTFGELPIPNLPIEQQQFVVDTISPIDDKIENNKKINHHLEQMAMAIFKSWFVDFEPFGGIQPSDFNTGKAEEFFEIGIGKTPPRKETEWFTTDSTNVKWVSISDMGNCGMFISDSSEYLTEQAVERFNIKIIPEKTVLLSFKLTIGRIAITDTEMVSNEAIAHFKTSNVDILEYLYCYLKQFEFETLGNTSSIATAVNSKTIKSMPFTKPSDIVLRNFREIVSPIFEEIRSNIMEIFKLQSIRDTILPKLLSGEISVNQAAK